MREGPERFNAVHTFRSGIDQCTNHVVGSYRRHFTSPLSGS
jgi:hypothetical protein